MKNKNIKLISLYLLSIISFYLVSEFIVILSGTFLIFLIFPLLPIWVCMMLIVITPPSLFITFLSNPKSRVKSFKEFRELLLLCFKSYYLTLVSMKFGFFGINIFPVNKIIKHRLLLMGDIDYMEPTIPREDSIVYKLFDKKKSSLNNGKIVIFRNKLDICVGRISSIKKDSISIKPDNKNYIDEYKEWNRIPIDNIIGILLFNVNPSKNPLIKK
jgi:hypothetical protein